MTAFTGGGEGYNTYIYRERETEGGWGNPVYRSRQKMRAQPKKKSAGNGEEWTEWGGGGGGGGGCFTNSIY